jgi:histone deacetylase complex regulatory component SIN3
VVQRVLDLFAGRPELIKNFNCFLPHGYILELSKDGKGATLIDSEGVLEVFSVNLPGTLPAHNLVDSTQTDGAGYSAKPMEYAVEYFNSIEETLADWPGTFVAFLSALSDYHRGSYVVILLFHLAKSHRRRE